jgi:hypothetical protein
VLRALSGIFLALRERRSVSIGLSFENRPQIERFPEFSRDSVAISPFGRKYLVQNSISQLGGSESEIRAAFPQFLVVSHDQSRASRGSGPDPPPIWVQSSDILVQC